jgi:type I restriction enzyme S subunit
MDALPSEGLPPGWGTAPLETICDINPATDISALSSETAITFVPMAAVGALTNTVDTSTTRPLRDITTGFTRFQSGDVIFAKITPCMENGKIALVPELPHGIGIGSTEFHVVRPKPGIDAAFVCHYLMQESFRATARRSMSGAVGQQRVPAAFLREALIPVAPTAEQTRIVTAVNALFDEVEAGEAALARAREGLTQFRASLLHAACTGALSSDGGEGWQTKPLAELISEGPKNGYSPKAGDNDNGTLSLKLTATTSGRLNLAPHAVKRLSETVPRGSPLYLRSGDLLFQRGNTPEYVGIAAIYDGPPETYVYPDLMIRVRTPDPALTGWIWRVANAPAGRRHMRNAASGTAGSMPKITGDAVRSLPIPLPPHEEMRRLLGRIEEELNAADEAEALLNAQQAAAVTLRQSILHAAFTGRLVAQNPADEPAAALLARLRDAPAAARRPRARRTATQPDLIETPA